MRRNSPVTQNEYLLNDGSTLMSTTDTKSHITYANSAFIEASGYKEEHLGNDSKLLIVFYVQIMPDDFIMQLHRF